MHLEDLLLIYRLKTNVVVGFSWRTGIFLGNDNPAYGLWYDLRDHRTERKLKHLM